MPPESFSKIVTKKSDYWSLGIILYELLYNTLPFENIDTNIALYKLLTTDIDIDDNLPLKYWILLKGLLIRNPEKRFYYEDISKVLKAKNQKELINLKNQLLSQLQLTLNTTNLNSNITSSPKKIIYNQQEFTINDLIDYLDNDQNIFYLILNLIQDQDYKNIFDKQDQEIIDYYDSIISDKELVASLYISKKKKKIYLYGIEITLEKLVEISKKYIEDQDSLNLSELKIIKLINNYYYQSNINEHNIFDIFKIYKNISLNLKKTFKIIKKLKTDNWNIKLIFALLITLVEKEGLYAILFNKTKITVEEILEYLINNKINLLRYWTKVINTDILFKQFLFNLLLKAKPDVLEFLIKHRHQLEINYIMDLLANFISKNNTQIIHTLSDILLKSITEKDTDTISCLLSIDKNYSLLSFSINKASKQLRYSIIQFLINNIINSNVLEFLIKNKKKLQINYIMDLLDNSISNNNTQIIHTLSDILLKSISQNDTNTISSLLSIDKNYSLLSSFLKKTSKKDKDFITEFLVNYIINPTVLQFLIKHRHQLQINYIIDFLANIISNNNKRIIGTLYEIIYKNIIQKKPDFIYSVLNNIDKNNILLKYTIQKAIEEDKDFVIDFFIDNSIEFFIDYKTNKGGINLLNLPMFENKRTIFHLAVINNSNKILKVLLSEYYDIIDFRIKDELGLTAMDYYYYVKDEETRQLLKKIKNKIKKIKNKIIFSPIISIFLLIILSIILFIFIIKSFKYFLF